MVSLFLPLFNKNNHDLVSLVTRIHLKDPKEFEGPIEEKEPLKEEEKDDGREPEQQD